LFPEEKGKCEELNNSPQTAAAIIHGGLPERRRSATSQQQTCHMTQEVQQYSAKVVAVGLGQRGQTGSVDFGPGVKSTSGPCAKG